MGGRIGLVDITIGQVYLSRMPGRGIENPRG